MMRAIWTHYSALSVRKGRVMRIKIGNFVEAEGTGVLEILCILIVIAFVAWAFYPLKNTSVVMRKVGTRMPPDQSR